MNYNYLRYFSVLAQMEHYTLAAARLGISQPSLSSAIHHLEDELGGIQLFEKVGRNIRLTEEGRYFQSKVDSALQELQMLCDLLRSQGFGSNVRVDFSVGTDMKYYSGVVFRGYLEGIPASVLSGGQYDKLPRKMGRNAKAIGFAVYLDLLANREEDTFDVDTLILHDGSADPMELMAASQEAAALGTVLVTRELPQGRNWKILRRFEKGAWVK